MKTCSKCGLVKNESEFHRDRSRKDGLQSFCIECRKNSRDWEQKNREKYNARMRKYHADHMDKVVERTVRYRKNNPEKYRAHCIVRNEIKYGRLVRETCEVPKCNTVGQAHHDDYTKPFDVRWLCTKHHNELHRKVKNESYKCVRSPETISLGN